MPVKQPEERSFGSFEEALKAIDQGAEEIWLAGKAFLDKIAEILALPEEDAVYGASQGVGYSGLALQETGCFITVDDTVNVRESPGVGDIEVVARLDADSGRVPVDGFTIINNLSYREWYHIVQPDGWVAAALPTVYLGGCVQLPFLGSDLTQTELLAIWGITIEEGSELTTDDLNALVEQLTLYDTHFRDESWTLEELNTAIEVVGELRGYGIILEGKWTLVEIQIIKDVVLQHFSALTALAQSMDYRYDDPIAVYRELFGYKDGTFTIVRATTNTVNLPDGSLAWAENTGYGILNLGNWVFTKTGTTFDAFTLIGHELTHTINWKDWHRARKGFGYNIVVDGEPRMLDDYYKDFLRSETRILTNSYIIIYTEQSDQSTTVVNAGTVVDLGRGDIVDDGFDPTKARARRSDDLKAYEFVTDALNAWLMSLYTIGPQYNLEDNKKGLARKEQGDELWGAILAYMLGPQNIPLP